MKKVNRSIKWAAMCLCVVSLFSCTKTIDTSKDSVSLTTSDDLTFPTTNEFANCKLRRIYQKYSPMGATVSAVFTYNGQGNPVSVVYNDDYAEDHFFTYDNKARLKTYNNAFGSFHHYAYDAANKIVRDTLMLLPGSTGDKRYVSTFTYDSEGRIVKENIKNYYNGVDYDGKVPPLQPDRNPTYTYDVRGNLAVAGWKSSSYDNKVSIFRSHPVFQLIHRNYSKNNSSVQPKYNSKGLPLSVLPGNDAFFNMVNVDKAIYDCQ